jgi:radical SAM protein with 4Fe4S-binding SPASM domain
MVSSYNIHKWVENFFWFLNQFKKFGVSAESAIRRVYILEVRNPGWDPNDLAALGDFMRTVTSYILNSIYGGDRQRYFDEFLNGPRRGMNLFAAGYGYIGRGLTCALQSTLLVRGDMKIISCHRTGWKGFEGGELITDDTKVVDIEPINPMSFMATHTYDFRHGIKCSDCPINNICQGYCMGANHEMNGDMFIPVPTVCRLEMFKHMTSIQILEDQGIIDWMIRRLRSSRVTMPFIGDIDYLRGIYIDKPEYKGRFSR